jgi:hypothetical protein
MEGILESILISKGNLHEDWATPIIGGQRVNEIQNWLLRHPETTHYVVLDDGPGVEALAPHLIQPDPDVGILLDHVIDVCALLDVPFEKWFMDAGVKPTKDDLSRHALRKATLAPREQDTIFYPRAVERVQADCRKLFEKLAVVQKEIRDKLAIHADGKNLKGNELVGWLGEIYGKLLFDGKLVPDSNEHDFLASDGRRISVKTRRGSKRGWNQASAIPKIQGPDCPTHLLFVHLQEDYSIDRMWLFDWHHLMTTGRFKKHFVRLNLRSYIFSVDPEMDAKYLVYPPH